LGQCSHGVSASHMGLKGEEGRTRIKKETRVEPARRVDKNATPRARLQYSLKKANLLKVRKESKN